MRGWRFARGYAGLKLPIMSVLYHQREVQSHRRRRARGGSCFGRPIVVLTEGSLYQGRNYIGVYQCLRAGVISAWPPWKTVGHSQSCYEHLRLSISLCLSGAFLMETFLVVLPYRRPVSKANHALLCPGRLEYSPSGNKWAAAAKETHWTWLRHLVA